MIRTLLVAAILALASSFASAQRVRPDGIKGQVTSLGSNYFIMDSDGTDVKVIADANTSYRVEDRPGSASMISKDTEVTVAGTIDRPGLMHAIVVKIIPSTERVEGTVKEVKKDHFIMTNAKGEEVKVYVSRATTLMTNGKKKSSTKVLPDAKVIVTPITNHPDAISAWKVDVIEG